MSIDVSRLGPAARRQILQKLGEQARQREAQKKYRNEPDTRGGVRFDSRKEARRYDELLLLLKAGKIRDLKLQPQYTLQESYKTPDGKRVRAIRYVADFSYERAKPATRYFVQEGEKVWCPSEWETVVEDVKGHRTRDYINKKKMMIEKFGIEVVEI